MAPRCGTAFARPRSGRSSGPSSSNRCARPFVGCPSREREGPPLELELDGRVVRVRGIVDRLDRRPDGGLRVIDYKTGRSRLNVAELNQGRRIQLPLYALAAQEALGLGPVAGGL